MVPLYAIPQLPHLSNSLINETGFLNCSGVLERYNAHLLFTDETYKNLTISPEDLLIPIALKFKFSVYNRSGNFNGDFPIVFHSNALEFNKTNIKTISY